MLTKESLLFYLFKAFGKIGSSDNFSSERSLFSFMPAQHVFEVPSYMSTRVLQKHFRIFSFVDPYLSEWGVVNQNLVPGRERESKSKDRIDKYLVAMKQYSLREAAKK